MTMQLKAPSRSHTIKSLPTTSTLAKIGNAGLRRPSDLFVLKSSFFSPSLNLLLSPQQRIPASAAPRFSMRVASKQAYICRDCGYIYNERTPFEKVPDKYFCPVCGAPKRRFRAYEPAVAKNANESEARKARKAQIQRDEAIGRALPIAVVVGVVALAGLYFYLNNSLG
ncbi:hypothetical protein I3760_12G000500 [Carya illinoinensis]|uniref:Rubredoxin-like domain-containing protein n=1 Tax=Carya illinoinensis TaxID=32201 RepID=A0A922DF06_CARIL|nr:hypothetical protein I3760_12G000500 [Carya illinoinensis]KAG6683207.1 hypothetical protein I3842_12G000500 [Carya illinoinensis]